MSVGPDRLPDVLPAGRHGLPREYVLANQRERMLRAMAQVASEKGYAATSVADVIAVARVSRKTFYEHFRDKEECFLVAYDAGVETLFVRVGAVIRQDVPWPERARAGIARAIEVLTDSPTFARLCLVQVLAAGPRALERHAAARARFVSVVATGNGMREASGLDPVPQRVCAAVVGGLAALIQSHFIDGREEELPGLLPELVQFTLIPFAGPDAAVELAGGAGG